MGTGINPSINDLDSLASGVVEIFTGHHAFAALEDGSVVTWGGNGANGQGVPFSSDVTQISATSIAFAGLKEDGSVITWGYPRYGGDSSSVASELYKMSHRFFQVKRLRGIKRGRLCCYLGRSITAVTVVVSAACFNPALGIYMQRNAFAALEDSSVVTWGNQDQGGNSNTVSANKLWWFLSQIHSMTKSLLLPSLQH